MFSLRKLKYRPWPVRIKLLVASETGDGVDIIEEEKTIVLHFKPFSEAQLKSLIDAGTPDKSDTDDKVVIAETLARNAVIFPQLIEGWSGVKDEETGASVPYDEALLCSLITGPDGLALSTAIWLAVNEIRFGIAPAKNLQNSATPGPSPEPVAVAGTNLPETSPNSV